MKYLFYIMVLSTLIACKKEDVKTYDGPDGVSFWAFGFENYHVNPQSFSFAYALVPKAKDTYFIRVRTTGKVSTSARKVTLKAVEGTTARAGTDYELPTFTVPANTYEFLYPITLINSPQMLTQTFRLVLEPLENEDFKLGSMGVVKGTAAHRYKNGSIYDEVNFKRFTLDINNILVQPPYWSTGTFGTFSAVKYRFMVQVTGLTDFSEDTIGVDGSYNLPVKLRNELAKYEAINGPLLDENGVRVTF